MQWLPLCKYLHPQVYFGKRCATIFVKAADAPATEAEPMDLPYGTATISQAASASFVLGNACFCRRVLDSWQGKRQTCGKVCQVNLPAGFAGCLVKDAAESNTAGPVPALQFRLLQSQLHSCISASLAGMINGCLAFSLRYAISSCNLSYCVNGIVAHTTYLADSSASLLCVQRS